MKAKVLGFSKQERLCGEQVVSELFASGRSDFAHPFRVVWKWVDRYPHHSVPVRVLIVVPKRQWKRAVDRNRIKRLVREGYRTTKPSRPSNAIPNHQTLLIAFVWSAKRVAALEEVQDWMMKKLPNLIWSSTASDHQSSVTG
jgi:ribonuclease P protein component